MNESDIFALLFDSKIFGSVFLGGIVTNWMASAGQWAGKQSLDLMKQLTSDDLQLLLNNHHLMRVVRIAQCRAMQAVCGRCLEKEYQQVVPLHKTPVSKDLWRRFSDPEIRAVLWWMKQFEAEACRAEVMNVEELEAELHFQLKDIPALQRAGAEISSSEDYEDLKERVTQTWIDGLHTFELHDLAKNPLTQFEYLRLRSGLLPERLLLPSTLKAAIKADWFDFLRVAFRELLKSGQHKEANIAFQNDILARLSDTPSLDQIEELLNVKDTEWIQRWKSALAWLDKIRISQDEIKFSLDRIEDKEEELLNFGRRNQRNFEDLPSRVVAEIKKELTSQGKTLSDLTQEELELELSLRVPNLRLEDLHRLIGYALFKVDISRITKFAPEELIGREDEINLLKETWAKVCSHEPEDVGRCPHILSIVAPVGEGKSSLVAKWMMELAAQGWPGCDAAFAWSFHRQGTDEKTADSSELFLSDALTFFDDATMANSSAHAFVKGQRLAQLVGERRILLILDGVEPLQCAPHLPTRGDLKDAGIAALLKGLAANSHGLCIVITRYAISDLRVYNTAPMLELTRLSREAGIKLLRLFGVKGSLRRDIRSVDGRELLNEFEKLVEDVQGNALALNLLGGFLKRAFKGDIRQRNRVKFEKADQKIQGGHAFRTLTAYVQWMKDESEESRRELAILQLIGLFDRPATADCVAALRRAPAIRGLTEPLVKLAEEDWEFSLTSLEEAKLLMINRDEASGVLQTIDAHPLLREYFARQLCEQQPIAWRKAHRRLYEHLCTTTPDKSEPTLEDLQPLYQAVAHGCHAGLHVSTLNDVYKGRILKGDRFYSVRRLGSWGTDLEALSGFFKEQWAVPLPKLTQADKAFVLNESGRYLRSLGRGQDAIAPISGGLEIRIAQATRENSKDNWEDAAKSANNLVMAHLILGNIPEAVKCGEQGIEFADKSGFKFYRVATRAHLIQSLHCKGEVEKGREVFEIALYELDKLSDAEWNDKAFDQQWRRLCDFYLDLGNTSEAITRTIDVLKKAEKRAEKYAIATNNLVLGEAYYAINSFDEAEKCLNNSVENLQVMSDELPRALISRAQVYVENGKMDEAQGDLDWAWEIAARGPLVLFKADIQIYRARLFCRDPHYPWVSPQDDLAKARHLIEKHGYGLRKVVLEDTELQIKAVDAS